MIWKLITLYLSLMPQPQLAVSVVRKGWKGLLFQSRRVHGIKPLVTPGMMVWSHFPLKALRWRRGLLFLPEKAEQKMRNSCIYLNIHNVNLHLTSVFPTCYPPSLLRILVLIRSQKPVEICIKMLLTWEVAGYMS